MKVPKLDRLAPHSIVSDSRPGLNILQMNEHDEGNHGGQVWELDFRFTTNKFQKALVAIEMHSLLLSFFVVEFLDATKHKEM